MFWTQFVNLNLYFFLTHRGRRLNYDAEEATRIHSPHDAIEHETSLNSNGISLSVQKNRNGQENEYGFIPPHNGSRYGYDAEDTSWVDVMNGLNHRDAKSPTRCPKISPKNTKSSSCLGGDKEILLFSLCDFSLPHSFLI